MKNKAIILFLKAPEPGRVKTRLRTGLSEAEILEWYKAFAEDTIDAARACGDVFLFFSPPGKVSVMRAWLGHQPRLVPQDGDDLGKRMAHAFDTVFHLNYRVAVLAGTDIPLMDTGHLDGAFELLKSNDAVLGPSEDGGYYLVGFQKRRFFPSVFYNMVWSTASVLDETRKRFESTGLSYGLLDSLNDIDTPEDLEDLKQRILGGASAGQRVNRLVHS